VGRSRRAGGRTDITTVLLESQPQRTTGTTALPPAAAGIDTALLVVHQLLNNPPPSGASPLAAEQWRHDVDQLVVAAINTSHHKRRCQPFAQQSRTPSTAHAPSGVHAPSVVCAPPAHPNACSSAQRRAPMASYMTAGLRDKINRRHGGEDSRTAIERHHKRRRNIEGRNLEKDFDSHAPVRRSPVAHAPRPLAPWEVWEGAWRLPHTCVWWSGHTSFSPTYQRSTTGHSTPLNSCISTPPPTLQQEVMRPSWPTTFL
jgi:hypothetical protein